MKWIADEPGHEGRDHADDERSDRHVDAGLRRSSSLRASNTIAPAVIGVAIRNAKRAAASRSRPASRPAEIEMPDRLMPGHERQRLGDTDADRDRERHVLDAPRPWRRPGRRRAG